MITHIFGSQRPLNKALDQGRLVRVEKCFSGVLGSDPLDRRIALTTGPAFTALEMNPALKGRLLAEINDSGRISNAPFEDSSGFSYVLYNEKTVGLMLNNSEKESNAFQLAEDAIQNRFYRSGQNRRILLATWGISAPDEVDFLPAKDFGAILVKLATVARDPYLLRTTVINLTDNSLDSVRQASDGSLHLSLSRAKLAEEELVPRTLLGTRPVPPTATDLFLDSIRRLWGKVFGN